MLSRRRFLRNTAAAAALAPLASRFTFSEPPRKPHSKGAILLNSNENAYGAFLSVRAAMADAVASCNRYPDSQYEALVNRLAELHRVAPSQVILGYGSTEILRMAAQAFTSRDRKLVIAQPTFEAIAGYTRVLGNDVAPIPLTAAHAHDLDRMAPPDAGLIYICNPNNPTASLTPRKDIEAFLQKLPATTYVLIDEAYHHFALDSPDYVSFLDRPMEQSRVVVARTFSKVYGMAGLRLGYAIASPQTIEALRRYQLFDNANAISLSAAVMALDANDALRAAIQRNAADRSEFLKQAASRRLTAIPSFANFVMLDAARPTRTVIDQFKRNNIILGRPFPPMDTFVRVSLGTPAEMHAFWQTWDGMKN